MDKFHFYNYFNADGKPVVACTTFYRGKTIRATATCAAEDNFDEEQGKALAMARCKVKYYEAKKKHAVKTHDYAIDALDAANKKVISAAKFVIDTRLLLNKAEEELSAIESQVM